MIRHETDYEPAVNAWLTWLCIHCDYCPATFPPNGLLAEEGDIISDIHGTGWSVWATPGLACCPDCYRRLLKETP